MMQKEGGRRNLFLIAAFTSLMKNTVCMTAPLCTVVQSRCLNLSHV